MIKCNECNVEIRGAKYMIMAELSTLVHALYSDVFIKDEGMEPEAARKEILSAVEIGFKADEDVRDEMICAVLLKACAMREKVLGKEW